MAVARISCYKMLEAAAIRSRDRCNVRFKKYMCVCEQRERESDE